MNEKVVKVYSEAFFELSKEKNKLDKNRQELKEIEEILKNYKEINQIISNPNVSKADKKDLLAKLFDCFDKDVVNLLYVLVDKSRFEILNDLIRDYNQKYKEEKGIMEGIVYSASKLDSSDINDLVNTLEKKYKKQVELTNEIDESLISGVSIYIEGTRIENSVKNRLESLRARLKKEGE